MTKKVDNLIVLEQTAPAECSDCGLAKELRPYGKDGAWVCFSCGMKDEEEASRQFSKLFSTRDI